MADETFADRLEQLIKKESSAKVAKHLKQHGVNVSGTSVHGYRHGSEPRISVAQGIAQVYGVSLDWLATGKGDRSPDAIAPETIGIPHYDLRRNAHPSIVESSDESIRFDRQWLQQTLGVDTQLFSVTVGNSAMAPRHPEGSWLLLQYANTYSDAGTYLVDMGSALTLRHIDRSVDEFTVSALEDTYRVLALAHEQFEAVVRIHGRVRMGIQRY